MAKHKFPKPHEVEISNTYEDAVDKVCASGKLMGGAHISVVFVRRHDGGIGVHIIPETKGFIDPDALEYAFQQGIGMILEMHEGKAGNA